MFARQGKDSGGLGAYVTALQGKKWAKGSVIESGGTENAAAGELATK